MGTVQELNLGDTRTAPGREDGGQEQAVRVTVIADKMEHLLKLYRKCEDAKGNLSDAIKSVAESGGIHASVLKRFIAARGGDGFLKSKVKSEQLQLLFDEIGE